MSLVMALALLQVGPFVTGAARPVSPVPPELQDRRRRAGTSSTPPDAPAAPLPLSAQLRECLDQAASAPATALITAGAWRLGKLGTDAAPPLLCLGTAQANLARWDEAEGSFIAARDAAGNGAARAGLGEMAGNAALASGANERALGLLDSALVDAGGGEDKALMATIEVDRARALVALHRDAEAAAALGKASEAAPTHGEAWLLSATLSRRMNDLATAQVQIEKAAGLMPLDPDVGLEAGVIAVLSGHDDAARKSWNSVIAAAPESPQAATARGYLEQLGPK